MKHEVILPADALAPVRARNALHQVIPTAEFADRLADARLAISEVVSNAIAHGHLRPGQDSVRLMIEVDEDRVRIDVEQKTSTLEARVIEPGAAGSRIGGFGLGIVRATADSWGVEAGPPGRVWFEFRR